MIGGGFGLEIKFCPSKKFKSLERFAIYTKKAYLNDQQKLEYNVNPMR
jgi:hypothetical protein